MVLSDCDMIQAECIFLLIDNGIVLEDVCEDFMAALFATNPEMYVLLDWMLMRWVLLRKHKFHLPKRRRNPTFVNLNNLINSDCP